MTTPELSDPQTAIKYAVAGAKSGRFYRSSPSFLPPVNSGSFFWLMFIGWKMATASCLKHSIKGDFNFSTRDEVEKLMGALMPGRFSVLDKAKDPRSSPLAGCTCSIENRPMLCSQVALVRGALCVDMNSVGLGAGAASHGRPSRGRRGGRGGRGGRRVRGRRARQAWLTRTGSIKRPYCKKKHVSIASRREGGAVGKPPPWARFRARLLPACLAFMRSTRWR